MTASTEVRRGIGASEAAAAAGVNPRKPRIKLWQELIGIAPPFEGNVHTEWGLRLEPIVQQKYAEMRGDVYLMRNPATRYLDEWKRASPDALVCPASDLGADPTHGLEVKCPEWRDAERWGEPGTDDVPTEYLVQCVWSMHVVKLPRWDVAALIGAHDYREYRIDRDDELEGMLVQEVERFWRDYVLTGEPPPPDGSTEYSQYLAKKHSIVRNQFVDATTDMVEMIVNLRHAKAMEKQAGRDIAMLEQEIKVIVGNAAGIEYKNGNETVRLTCRPRKGRVVVDWSAIMDELVAKGVVRSDYLNSLLTTYSRESTASRPLLTPRSWSADVTVSAYTPKEWERKDGTATGANAASDDSALGELP